MGTSAEGPLSADCPVCGDTHRHQTVIGLKRAVNKCCRKQKKERRKSQKSQIWYLPKKPEMPTLPLILTFDRLIKSQNHTTYSHWSRYYADEKDWLRRVRLQTQKYQGLYLPWSSWRVERIYRHPAKEMDYANLVGGAKPLIDSLIKCRMIVDDRPANFECDYQQYPGDRSMTILTLIRWADERPPT